jgi:hypothetical protein
MRESGIQENPAEFVVFRLENASVFLIRVIRG